MADSLSSGSVGLKREQLEATRVRLLEAAVAVIEALLAETEARLADGRRSILGGDTINYTDIAFAAIQGAWLQPEGYGGGAGIRIERSRAPAAMRRDIERWVEEYPRVTRYVEDLYAVERKRNEDV